MNRKYSVIYWDTSAILSVIFKDIHSDDAVKHSSLQGVHLISSLAFAETHAVINRIRREHLAEDVIIEAALEGLETGPWRRLNIGPDISKIKKLSSKWSLRGADLWHLASAKTLQKELPELTMLTYDKKLYTASAGEGLIQKKRDKT